MTEETFRKLEAICKAEWQRLAETGDRHKRGLGQFLNHCPACHITRLVDRLPRQNCVLCPIDKWRTLAQEHKLIPRAAACECFLAFPGGIEIVSEYGRWDYCIDIDDRKKYAKLIAELPWSYLPEYANIKEEGLPL